MSEENKEKSKVELALERIEKLNDIRERIEHKKNELEVHERDLSAIKTINGEDSNEYKVKELITKTTSDELDKLIASLEELSYKKSELKPILDECCAEFEKVLKENNEKEYHIELGTTDEEGKSNGKRVFKDLLGYVQNDVEWTAKTATALMIIDTNMQENKPWVNDKDFDGVITLRSASILGLWHSIMENMHGTGSLKARKFLTVWANCGKSISDAVRQIQEANNDARTLGANCNTIEQEYNMSVDDLSADDGLTIKDEVDPEV